MKVGSRSLNVCAGSCFYVFFFPLPNERVLEVFLFLFLFFILLSFNPLNPYLMKVGSRSLNICAGSCFYVFFFFFPSQFPNERVLEVLFYFILFFFSQINVCWKVKSRSLFFFLPNKRIFYFLFFLIY